MSGVSSLTVDTRHVTRYQEEINLNSVKSHSQCLDWLLILKLSLVEMTDYSTDDNVCNTSPPHGFQSRATSIFSLTRVTPLPLLDLTSCTRLTLGVSSVQRGPGCTLVPTLSATLSPQQPMGG